MHRLLGAGVRARKVARLCRILGSRSCPKSGQPAPHSGLDFVTEKWAACATFWARFRARNVGSLRHFLGSISWPKSGQPAPHSGLDFVPEKWARCCARFGAYSNAAIHECHISGTKSSPLFGHEIEPRMWRSLPTFRARNRARKVAQAAHVSGTKSLPECGAGGPRFGHEIEPRIWHRRAAFQAQTQAQNVARVRCLSGDNSVPDAGAGDQQFEHGLGPRMWRRQRCHTRRIRTRLSVRESAQATQRSWESAP